MTACSSTHWPSYLQSNTAVQAWNGRVHHAQNQDIRGLQIGVDQLSGLSVELGRIYLDAWQIHQLNSGYISLQDGTNCSDGDVLKQCIFSSQTDIYAAS